MRQNRIDPDRNPNHHDCKGDHAWWHMPPISHPVDGHHAKGYVSKTQDGGDQLLAATVQHPSSNNTDNDALVLVVGGVAVASGENTLTTGEVHTDVKDMGRITKATGEATFIAAAESPGGNAYADADTFADAVGADIVFIRTIESGPDYGSDGTALATSTTKVVAIDIEGFDFAGGPIVIDSTLTLPSRAHYAHLDLSGHVASVTADANAAGDNTLASTETFALIDATADNPFSIVSGLAISGVA
jgi:hypothetical protein